ncbi:WhiB family transcriptional regulator [Streptomyces sp. NPDC001070]
MDWSNDAACREVDPELFFPISGSGLGRVQIDEAKAVCRRCPVMARCLEWALAAGHVDGVWGGTTESERREMRRRDIRGCAREATEPAA